LRKFGLIGRSLSHSFSQSYFEKKFLSEGITDASYQLLEKSNLDNIADWLIHQQFRGVNVTIPYKEEIIPHLHLCTDEAREIGAVNCIVIQDGKLIGHNTDAYGFEVSIRPFLENKYERALILGNGGASKAIAFTLKKWNIPFWMATRKPTQPHHFAWTDLNDEMMKHFKLIINCTPLGTYPNVHECPPIPYSALTEEHFLYDLIYNPEETAFLQKGKAQGALVMNGLPMLRLQAEKSWSIWNM
jgi:shikimate dehydrogenase